MYNAIAMASITDIFSGKGKLKVIYVIIFLVTFVLSLLVNYYFNRQFTIIGGIGSFLLSVLFDMLYYEYITLYKIDGNVNDITRHVKAIHDVVTKDMLFNYEDVVDTIFNNNKCISEYRHIYIVSFLPSGALQLLNKLSQQNANLDLQIYIYLPTIWEAICDIEDQKRTGKDLVHRTKEETRKKYDVNSLVRRIKEEIRKKYDVNSLVRRIKEEIRKKYDVNRMNEMNDTMNFLRQLYHFKTNQGSDVNDFFSQLSEIIDRTSKISLYLGLLTPPFISTVFANKSKLSINLSLDNFMIIKSHVYYKTYSLSDKAHTNTILSNIPCFPSLFSGSKDGPTNIASRTIGDIVMLLDDNNDNIVKVDLLKEQFLMR